MGHFNFPQRVQEVLRKLSGSVVQAEQYMDFLRNRMFRQSLLMRNGVRLSRTVRPEVMHAFSVASAAQLDESAELAVGEARFVTRRTKETLTTKDPLLKAALQHIGSQWPMPVPFDEVVAKVGRDLAAEPATVAASLGSSLLRLYLSSHHLELHVAPASFVLAPGSMPVASPLARHQAASATDVTNLRHETVRLEDLDRHLLRQLDGTRTREALLADLRSLADRGALTVTSTDDLERALTARLDLSLQRLAAGALLVS